MQRHRHIYRNAPPSWWVRCSVLALACLQVVAPTWHICAEGATGAAPGQKLAMAHSSCAMPQSASNDNSFSQLKNQPMAMDYCLARLLQHVLGNNQFHLVLDFNAVTVSTLADAPADDPLNRTLSVIHARGPPFHLL